MRMGMGIEAEEGWEGGEGGEEGRLAIWVFKLSPRSLLSLVTAF